MYIQHPGFIQLGATAIPIDPANSDYRAYLEWIADGNTPDEPPALAHSQLWERAIAEMRVQRQPILEVLDGLQSSALTFGNSSRAQVIETAKQGLRDITKINLLSCTTYEEMRLTVGAAYYALAGALPADIRLAFSEASR
jgi:hypothetical protein